MHKLCLAIKINRVNDRSLFLQDIIGSLRLKSVNRKLYLIDSYEKIDFSFNEIFYSQKVPCNKNINQN